MRTEFILLTAMSGGYHGSRMNHTFDVITVVRVMCTQADLGTYQQIDGEMFIFAVNDAGRNYLK